MAITRQIATALIEGALKDGGITLNLSTNRGGRYIVGGIGTFTVPAETARGSHDNMARQLAPWSDDRHDTLGSWLDTETGTIHVDYGTRHASLETALNLARGRGELAIWDSVANQEIRLSEVVYGGRVD